MLNSSSRSAMMVVMDALGTALAAILAPMAGTAWWMLIDQIPAERAFSSPIPYALTFVSLFVATPIYLALRQWLGRSLIRMLALASLGAAPFAIKAVLYFLTPRDVFAAFLILSTAWVSALVFWCVLRLTVKQDVERES